VKHRGRHFEAVRNTANPAPAQTQVPIWIGGNSKLSRRRAAEKAEGWMPIPNPRTLGGRRRTVHIDDADDLRLLIEDLHAHASAIGRKTPIDIFFPAMERSTGKRYFSALVKLDLRDTSQLIWKHFPIMIRAF